MTALLVVATLLFASVASQTWVTAADIREEKLTPAAPRKVALPVVRVVGSQERKAVSRIAGRSCGRCSDVLGEQQLFDRADSEKQGESGAEAWCEVTH